MSQEILPRTIHPYPNSITWGREMLRLGKRAALKVSRDTDATIIELMKDSWRRFTHGAVELDLTADQESGVFVLSAAGKTVLPELKAQATYALSVDGAGVAARASDATAMRHAWFTLLQLLQADESDNGALTFTLPHVTIQDWPALKFRGLHLCVFPETTLVMIEKAIRLAGLFKFTHIVLEFWGMLRLETLRELSWTEAWPKSQAHRLVAIARGMGMEVIPMFNCWGHAAASRIRCGRHVVLDQNPALAPLFEPDGWTWCLTNHRARALLQSVCDELADFAGPGKFFHIGCDEAYSHATCDRCRQRDRVQLFADHVNNIAGHLESLGRRAIMWGDALLERAKWPAAFAANGTPTLPTHEALENISRRIVIADWHYDVKSGDVPTVAHFRQRGFDVMTCPWNSGANIQTLAKAAAHNSGLGLLMTTWHHLPESIPTLAVAANAAWSQDLAAFALTQNSGSLMRAATATILRKLVPADSQFARAGWYPFETAATAD